VAARSGDERARSMRQAIARLMTISNAEIPHYHLARTIDVEACVEWLAARNATRPASERVLLAALLLRATALATAAHPELNGHWVDGGFRAAEGVQLGVAVAVRGGGLITPVMHDAQLLDVDATMATLRDLVTRARRAALRSSDLSPASITVTDLGDRGADEVFGVIHPPQVALVGFGRVAERPWATDGLLGVRHTVRATLSADHRATDGHVGSGLLATISELLGDPDRLDRPPDRPRGAA
jgi:pyruvate dehydrogenase E2 component (dihydrolipoamide acetyltransferase)